jgi:Zn-dependent protease with chaperone function
MATLRNCSFRGCRSYLSFVISALLLASQLTAATSGPDFPNPGNPHMSRAQQRQLGLQAATQVYQQMPVLPDSSPETQYIRQLGQKLVATVPQQYSWPFEFHVVAQKDINAFALPGGPMFVNIGTITAAKDEAELAGVMAHEMSHVIMQHSAKQADKAQWTGLLAGIASGVAGATLGGMAGQAAQMGISMGAQGLSLKYSRGDEAQADAVGAIILYKAGYNPQALADFFKTLETEGGATPPQLLSDHPNPGNRTLAIEKEIQNWPPKNYTDNSAAFQKVRQHALTVKAYTGEEIAQGAKSGQWAALNKKNGAVFNPVSANNLAPNSPVSASTSPSHPTVAAVSLQSVLPSERMVATDLGPIKLSRPENWEVNMPKARGEYVTIAPQAAIVAGGVGYGVLINGIGTNGQRISIDDITRELVENLERTEGVHPAGDAQPITVAGMQGRSVALKSSSPFSAENGQPQQERDWLVTVPEQNGNAIFFLFVAPQPEFERFRPTFESMLKSVKF